MEVIGTRLVAHVNWTTTKGSPHDATLAEQKELGIVPEDAVLNPRPRAVSARGPFRR